MLSSGPLCGYGVSEVRKKLKEEYTKLSGREIGELRKKGVEVNYECNAKFLCYLGDTSKEIFEGQADKTFHSHWRNLEPIVDKYKENNFILIHFSQRYENSWLTELFKEKNKTNVYPWIN